MVGNLLTAKDYYIRSADKSLESIVNCLNDLVQFYPAHIEKEDKHFFYSILEYFDAIEQGGMLNEFNDFDGRVIHEKYQKLVEEFERDRT